MPGRIKPHANTVCHRIAIDKNKHCFYTVCNRDHQETHGVVKVAIAKHKNTFVLAFAIAMNETNFGCIPSAIAIIKNALVLYRLPSQKAKHNIGCIPSAIAKTEKTHWC